MKTYEKCRNKEALKSKQTVYLCNRNKAIINQVYAGLYDDLVFYSQ